MFVDGLGKRVQLGALGLGLWSVIRPVTDAVLTPQLIAYSGPLHLATLVICGWALTRRRLGWTPLRFHIFAFSAWTTQFAAFVVSWLITERPLALNGVALLVVAAGGLHISSAAFSSSLGAAIATLIALRIGGSVPTDALLIVAGASVLSVMLFVAFRLYTSRLVGMVESERHQAMAAIETANQLTAELAARRAAEREREDLRERFVQAQKMDALGTLAGGVAHDINNVIAGIRGLTELLRNDVAPALRGDCDEILAACDRSTELTRGLLAFGRRGTFARTVVGLDQVVREVTKLLSRTAPKGIAITTELAAVPIEADRGQLVHAVMNLCVNAIDAIGERGRLELRVAEVELGDSRAAALSLAAGRYAQLTVRDNGCGMDDATRARIFEPFFTTKAEGRGTGLGLSMVYGTVKAHAGTLEVTSAPGVGSVFELYFPISSGVVAATVPEHSEPLAAERRRILVIDDDIMVRGMLQRALRAHGRDVVVADTAEQGVALLERGPVDLVILDMMMPGMGGAQGFAKLRELSPELKVILVSGYSDRGDVDRCLDHGAIDFLTKPFPISRLHDAVCRAFGERTSQQLTAQP